ncbi:Dehydrocurvularin biosynthesis regulator [Colletotrichum shisoi]|uniref:Dehydrocurvularin biosynthesis regulator n=1 Tax=Colletotrichum shisoi TaxID=2078593 RepID=A0A5Q4BD33_9PEZI|nr:Dehydrocurvularin biosynthesis regulator [Colletotrichum shisoi]
MVDATSTLSPDPRADSAPTPKRRKLRKGTQSCWECKRRKARCTFSAAHHDVCDGCTRRGTDCVSQEVADQPPPPGSSKHLVDRLGQVEALVKQLLRAGNGVDHGVGHGQPAQIRRGKRKTTSPSRSPVAMASECDSSASPSHSNGNHTQLWHSSSSSSKGWRYPASSPYMRDESSNRVTRPEQDAPAEETHDDKVCKRLLEAWPSQQDMDIILSIPVETSQIIRAVICTRTGSAARTSLPSSATLLEPPPPGSHPALVARSLLILASFLQGMPFSSAHHLARLSTPWQALMSRAVKAAHSLVTSDDGLVASLEGIECIMLEGLYENYAGNLRPSWLAARRSVAIAQMIGLNRGVGPKSLTGSVIEPSDLWFRLVRFDRYLSLMLGLPQSSLDDVYARPEALEGCTPLDRYLRLCTVACGRLLRRDPSDVYDHEINKGIDRALQEASALMPAQWWVTPTLSPDTGHAERIRDTLRFNDHFMYYHLLLQLHFPSVLRPVSECCHVYHRSTALAASREILSRMMAFRAARPARYYCRGVDLIAFFSSTALCLAHICDDTPPDVTAQHGFHFLAHQRLSDRGLLEQTLAIMQGLVDRHDDEIATRVAALLRHLLAIEADVASGGKYAVAFSPKAQKHDDLGYRVKMSDDGTTLRICLPHFWVIKIQKQGPSGGRLPAASSDGTELRVKSGINGDDRASFTSPRQEDPLPAMPRTEKNSGLGRAGGEEQALFGREGNEENWALENLDFAFLDSFIEGTLGLDDGVIAGES